MRVSRRRAGFVLVTRCPETRCPDPHTGGAHIRGVSLFLLLPRNVGRRLNRPATPLFAPRRYLTLQVAGYTLGWQVFRLAAEAAYLLSHGLGSETTVIKIFLACSMSSVLLCLLRRHVWLRWREPICISMNW
jgi:hypothetical protein